MSRNYDIVHYIQKNTADMDPNAMSAIVRMFNRLEDRNSYASALSTSVTLFLAMKYLKLSPKLILGTVQYQGLSYPHAWLELNEKIFDLAIYEDIKHHPVLKERGLTIIKPQINIEYEVAAKEICYYPFQFGETWAMADMKRLVGKTFESYIDASPFADILADVCYILEISEVPENLDFLRAIAKLETIKDEE